MKSTPNTPDFCSILRQAIDERLRRLSPKRYSQEPAYMAALISKIDDVFYTDSNYHLEIKGVIIADRGANSAEHQTGADFAIIATIKNRNNTITKALLGQAKKGVINRISGNLKNQIEKMGRLTENILVAETPKKSSDQFSVKIYDHKQKSMSKSMSLSTYFCEHLLSCTHGDKNDSFIKNVQDSNLNKIEIRFDIH